LRQSVAGVVKRAEQLALSLDILPQSHRQARAGGGENEHRIAEDDQQKRQPEQPAPPAPLTL